MIILCNIMEYMEKLVSILYVYVLVMKFETKFIFM